MSVHDIPINWEGKGLTENFQRITVLLCMLLIHHRFGYFELFVNHDFYFVAFIIHAILILLIFIIIRPNIICVFPITSLKKIGRDYFFYFTICFTLDLREGHSDFNVAF